jgi:hypothetical protein
MVLRPTRNGLSQERCLGYIDNKIAGVKARGLKELAMAWDRIISRGGII